jgi:hypothetical protein
MCVAYFAILHLFAITKTKPTAGCVELSIKGQEHWGTKPSILDGLTSYQGPPFTLHRASSPMSSIHHSLDQFAVLNLGAHVSSAGATGAGTTQRVRLVTKAVIIMA